MVCAERHARLEPLLQAIYDFLDKQSALVERVRRDLVRGLKQPWPTHSRATSDFCPYYLSPTGC